MGEGDEENQPTISALGDIKAIGEEYGEMITTREQIFLLVEPPLFQACLKLYDLNIKTMASSANSKDIEAGFVYVVIDFDSLSVPNRKIALSYGSIEETEKGNRIIISIPVNKNTTVDEIEKKSVDIANGFQKQPMTWAPKLTIKELETANGIESSSPYFNNRQTWLDMGYFYAEDEDVFYLSEEHYVKSHEQIDQPSDL